MSPFDFRLTIIARAAKVRTPHIFHYIHAMRETGFDPVAFAEFAGLELRHVERIAAAVKEHGAVTKPRRPTATGSRLTDSFVVPDNWIAWAVKERGWTPQDATQEGKSFVDYWIGVSGDKGVKANWEATWRNSVRRSHRPNGSYRANEVSKTPLEIAQQQLRTAEMLGQSYEADVARRRIDVLSNVVPFKIGQAG